MYYTLSGLGEETTAAPAQTSFWDKLLDFGGRVALMAERRKDVRAGIPVDAPLPALRTEVTVKPDVASTAKAMSPVLMLGAAVLAAVLLTRKRGR